MRHARLFSAATIVVAAAIPAVPAYATPDAATAPAAGSTSAAYPPAGPQPVAYQVRLSADDTGATWRGHQRVAFVNNGSGPLDTVWLRLWGNGPDGCTTTPAIAVSALEGGKAGPLAVGCTALPVRLSRPAAPGGVAAVAFDLTIRVPERADRFGRVGPYSFLGNALPLLAVRDERGWQLPPYVANAESFYSLTSNFAVSLNHPKELAVPATGTVLAEKRNGGRTTTTITAPLVRDFAWAAGPFRRAETRTATGVRLRTWYTPDVTAETAAEVQGQVARAMEFAAGEYGPYPYPEMDTVIGGFDGFSGMEYPTLILTEPATLPAVHEAAHQWWYALVGNDEYAHPWLDESLTQYTTTKLLGIPDYCAGAPFWFSDSMRVDAGMDYYDTRRDEYVPAVYGDGACMFHELEALIGGDAMRTGLRRYLAAQKFGVARPAELRAALQSATTVDLGDFWLRWRNTAD
ncbi:M1 family metallopeptidase [Actinoplanes sp. NPDC048796]|uniref:M1 family metallopeptidase n=1 Tax=Actinoplanes sp. NPDC048796 TaxID=3155640 RepID=UPI0033E61B38